MEMEIYLFVENCRFTFACMSISLEAVEARFRKFGSSLHILLGFYEQMPKYRFSLIYVNLNRGCEILLSRKSVFSCTDRL